MAKIQNVGPVKTVAGGVAGGAVGEVGGSVGGANGDNSQLSDTKVVGPPPDPSQPPPIKQPQMTPTERLYRWAKMVHTSLLGEPRHPELENRFVELGLAIKAYEADVENESEG